MNLMQATMLTNIAQPVVGGGITDTYGTAIAAITGLVSWWRFGDGEGAATALDEQGVQNGAYLGGVTHEHGALMAQTGNLSIRLDGTTGFIDITDNVAYHLASGTFAIWFTPDSLATTRYLISKNASGVVNGDLEFFFQSADNSLRFQLESATVVNRATNSGIIPQNVLTVGTTYCAVIQWGAAGMKLYLADGSLMRLIGTNTYTGGISANTNVLRIGASQWSGVAAQFFDGGLDEAILWNRQLSTAELEVVTQRPLGTTPPPPIGYTGFYKVKHTANTKIPAGWPTIAPKTSTMVANTTCTSTMFVNDIKTGIMNYKGPSYTNEFVMIRTGPDWAWPIRFAAPGDPSVHFTSQNPNPTPGGTWDQAEADGWTTIRWPSGAKPMTGSDGEIGIVNEDETFMTEFYQCNYPPTLTAGSMRRWMFNALPYAQPRDNRGSASACQMAKTATAIRYEELAVDHVIPHALSFSYNFPSSNKLGTSNTIFPCVRSGGYTANPLSARACGGFLGMRYQYDPTANPVTDCAHIDSRYRKSCEVVVKALQDYGMFLVDGSATPGIYAETLSNQGPGETRSWQDPAIAAAGYSLPATGFDALRGLSFTKLRVIEPISP